MDIKFFYFFWFFIKYIKYFFLFCFRLTNSTGHAWLYGTFSWWGCTDRFQQVCLHMHICSFVKAFAPALLDNHSPCGAIHNGALLHLRITMQFFQRASFVIPWDIGKNCYPQVLDHYKTMMNKCILTDSIYCGQALAARRKQIKQVFTEFLCRHHLIIILEKNWKIYYSFVLVTFLFFLSLCRLTLEEEKSKKDFTILHLSFLRFFSGFLIQ